MDRLKFYFGLVFFIAILGCSLPVHADSLSNILKSEKLRVGVSLYEPWVIKNKYGELDGFEIQIAKQLASDLGVNAEFVLMEWENLLTTLNANKIDIIIAGMAITPERALRANFTIPYADSGISIAANIAKTKTINSLDELNSPQITIGAVSNTVAVNVAVQVFNKANVKQFVKSEEAIQALLNGNIYALVESSPIPQFLALQHPGLVDAPLSKPLLSYKAGMAVNKGEQELLNYLNAWITARDAEGWIPVKHKYWFKSLDWKGK